LDDVQKSTFKVLPLNSDAWSYVSSITGGVYTLYGSSIRK
jgi:hypothetical protein